MWFVIILVLLLMVGGAALIHFLRKKVEKQRLKRTWRYRLENVGPTDYDALRRIVIDASNWATCAVGETFKVENIHQLEVHLFSTPYSKFSDQIKESGHAFTNSVDKMYNQMDFHTNREHAIRHLQDIQHQKSRLVHLGVKF